MHVVNLDFVYNSQKNIGCIEEETRIPYFTPLDDDDRPLPPPANSRVSGGIIDTCGLMSTSVSAEAIAR